VVCGLVIGGQKVESCGQPAAFGGSALHDADARRFSVPPSSSGGITRLAWARAKEAGFDPAPLARKAGLTIRQIEDADTRLSVQSQIKFLAAAADALRDEFLGFHLARDFDLRMIGWLHYVLASSEILGDALQRAARYTGIVNEGIALRYREATDVTLSLQYVGVARRSDRHQIEFLVTTIVRACCELTSRRLQPSRVKLTHHRSDFSEFNTFLGCDVEFGAEVDEVAFPATIKLLPIVSADPYLHELLISYFEEALSRRKADSAPLRSAVENAVAPLLPHGRARLGEVARRLGMSQRTLARRLAAEGLSFSDILDDMRLDLAKRHVADTQLSISQIAWLVGFQETSAFTHAFKRWTGRTPRQMRSQVSLPGGPFSDAPASPAGDH
jgi:AraC-like DNA-binding protein